MPLNLQTLQEHPEKKYILGLAAWFVAMIISISVYIGGVAGELQFSSTSICLLYVENYRKDAGLNAYIFDSFSPSCATSVSAGSIGLFILFGLILTRGFFYYKKDEPSRNVIMILALIASVWTFVAFIMACILSSGLSQTCTQFKVSGKSCAAVFGEGFFANSTAQIYRKNINTINAAVGASWAVFVGFGLYAAFEWNQWRHSSLKWW